MPSPKKIYFTELNVAPITQSIILLDIDGTLLADGEAAITDETATAVKKLSAQGNVIYLVSNGFSHKLERNRAIAKQLNVTYYETPYKKPLKLAVLPLITGATKPIVVIGDKFLTDGLLAINLGVPYVAVRSLRSLKDPVHSRIGYLLDAIGERVLGSYARPPYYRSELVGDVEPQPMTILTSVPVTPLRLPRLLHDRLKLLSKKLLFTLTRKSRYLTAGGPQAVIGSLLRGLTELKVDFQHNPWQQHVTPVVGVIRGAETLRWALDQKKRGFIKTIVAGPNIVVVPTDENNLIKDLAIDQIVVPSQWNKDWWVSFDQALERRITPWAAGVSDNGASRTDRGMCLVYAKNADEKLFQSIMHTLWEYKVPITVSSYGRFHQHEYFMLLKKAKFLIYLSQFESQGIALHEAWMADIPTLIWNAGILRYRGFEWKSPLLAAPYFDPACGLLFSGEQDFEIRLSEFLEKYDTFKPRDYSLAHFTDATCARKYLNIHEEVAQKNI